MSEVICQYCNKPAELVDGKAIYPHRPDLYRLKFWQCKPCGAYVGTHKGSSGQPLGVLADAELRKAKSEAHARFDPIWRESEVTRSQAYRMLSRYLGVSAKRCHIGMFDVKTCKRVGDFSRSYWGNQKHHKIQLLLCNNK